MPPTRKKIGTRFLRDVRSHTFQTEVDSETKDSLILPSQRERGHGTAGDNACIIHVKCR